MRRLDIFTAICLLSFGVQSFAASPVAPQGTIVQIDLHDVVHPISAEYVRQGIAHAKDIDARAVILHINSPGGLPDSMHRIAADIMDSRIPVITWVGPSGARAASRGLLVLPTGDVDLINPPGASNVSDIVRLLNGRQVRSVRSNPVILRLAGAAIEPYAMSARQRLLSRTLDPNVALILGMIGLFGIYFELSHPGRILPGLAGAICLILSLYSFSLLPVHGAGALLILLAVVLFVLEAAVASRGILGLFGIVSMMAGEAMLIESPIPEMRIHFATTVAVTLPVAAVMIFLVRLAVTSRRKKSMTGDEGGTGLDFFAEARRKE